MAELADVHLGVVTLHPSGPVVAGSVGTWQLIFTVGTYGIDEGGTIKVAQRFASDWQVPQFEHPELPGYTTAVTTGQASLALRYDPKGHERPWMKTLVLDVFDGSLAPGDRVTITMGDTSGGSPGIRAQSFQETRHEFRVLVDPTNACLVRRVSSSPGFPIVPGRPVRIVCVIPSNAIVGQVTEIFLRGEDVWGNPTDPPPGIELEWHGSASATIEMSNLIHTSIGEGRVVARWNGESFRSNPATVLAARPRWSSYWGDLHAQSDATVGTGDEVEYFTFGRDRARLDFTSHQGNDFQMTDEDWERLNRVVASFHEDGRFVVFPGFEWSANSPAGGDRNVFYLDEGRPIIRSSHWQIPGIPPDGVTPAHPVSQLFERIREHVPLDKVLLAAHVGGRYADIRPDGFFDEQLGPLVELTSCWGVFEWLLWDAFDRGYLVGVMANSDGHKGRPGAEGPGAGQFGIGGGLTCALSETLTRSAVFGALKRRRCYGTTGPRILLDFTADGYPMGSVLDVTGPVGLAANVVGTAPIEALQLFQGKEVLSEVHPPEFADLRASKRIRVSWGGSRIRGRGRRTTWDGSIRVEGNSILRADPFAFDSPLDGISIDDEHLVRFQSRTMGDVDGVDLWLAEATRGTVTIDTPVGSLSVDLKRLEDAPMHRSFGGIDLRASIRRYPVEPVTETLQLSRSATSVQGETIPYFVKVIQTDGHMAWASPIYLRST